ncbi:hypothetical protein RCO28_12555 [Streptomyces sp. LHD-70]|uniref:hypothetical protein n=1 Tax=Streptomyces sp. LHD-70 TaxID=3072140 RepID=UPI00280EBB2E|nr:hypothetical protein [Streptomyces sp. LHD-70]MDQ8703313.1 hypothetical protein [Streptomyces sp. LHD-70]
MSEFKLVMHRNWEYVVFHSTGTRDLVAMHSAKIAADAIKEAPRASATKGNWNQIKKHIEAHVEADVWGWRGNVTIEDNPKVRHAMLQERGWTDRRGRRHPGRRFLKAALLKARVE